MATATQLQDWALYLAGQGWPIFPLQPGSKRPAIKAWHTRATLDTDRIARCWAAGAYNIGIATGPARLVVLDLDTSKSDHEGPDGDEALAALAEARGVALPDTYMVRTPTGGAHHYYRAPDGVVLRNTTSHLAARIDTRAEGGYVVAPGSRLPGGGYELVDDTDPVELPGWILQALADRAAHGLSRSPEIAVTKPTTYAGSALSGECARVSAAPNGHHNHVLSTAAFNLGQLVAAGLLEHAQAHAELLAAGQALIQADCDCTHTETSRVITAGLEAGTHHPRTRKAAA